MSESLRVPGLSDSETITLNLLLEQLVEKSRRNSLRSSYYDGRHAIKDVGGVIPPQYASLGMVLGWAARGVDGLTRHCNLEQMVWANGDIDALGMGPLADNNFLYSEISQGLTDSLIHGVSYLITTQGNEGEPVALVHAKDALNATGDWNVRSRKLDNLLSITSRKDNQVTGFVLYLNNLTISATRTNGKWSVDRSEHPWGVPVEPLVYRPRSSRRMGRSRITRPVMSIQDGALRAVMRLEAHMDIYAIPKMILLGASESMFKNADGSPKSSWQIVMGRTFGIPDDDDAANPRADVKQFSAESPEPHLAQLNAQAKLMAREMGLPDSDFALAEMSNPTSAEAIDSGNVAVVAEAEGATDDWSVPIRRTVARALAIQNGFDAVPAEWSGIQAKWRDPRYLSRAAVADAGAKVIGAVPWLAESTVGLELLGLNPQQIERALADKRRAAGRAVIAGLVRPADANGA